MNGYIEGGYVVTLVALGGYAAALVGRERGARRRVRPTVAERPAAARPAAADGQASTPEPPGQGA